MKFSGYVLGRGLRSLSALVRNKFMTSELKQVWVDSLLFFF